MALDWQVIREMPVATNGMAEALRTVAMSVFGLILALTPLALWVAWTETGFILVLAAGATAGVLYWLLAGFQDPLLEDRGQARDPRETQSLTDEFLAELSRLGPWTYHNRRLGDAAFRRKMESLLRLNEAAEERRRRIEVVNP